MTMRAEAPAIGSFCFRWLALFGTMDIFAGQERPLTAIDDMAKLLPMAMEDGTSTEKSPRKSHCNGSSEGEERSLPAQRMSLNSWLSDNFKEGGKATTIFDGQPKRGVGRGATSRSAAVLGGWPTPTGLSGRFLLSNLISGRSSSARNKNAPSNQSTLRARFDVSMDEIQKRQFASQAFLVQNLTRGSFDIPVIVKAACKHSLKSATAEVKRRLIDLDHNVLLRAKEEEGLHGKLQLAHLLVDYAAALAEIQDTSQRFTDALFSASSSILSETHENMFSVDGHGNGKIRPGADYEKARELGFAIARKLLECSASSTTPLATDRLLHLAEMKLQTLALYENLMQGGTPSEFNRASSSRMQSASCRLPR